MEQGIYYIVIGCVSIICFLIGRGTPKVVSAVATMLSAQPMLMNWGRAFCQYAEQYLANMSGEDKHRYVANMIVCIAGKSGLDIDEDSARSIAQAAYDQWKNGLASSSKGE